MHSQIWCWFKVLFNIYNYSKHYFTSSHIYSKPTTNHKTIKHSPVKLYKYKTLQSSHKTIWNFRALLQLWMFSPNFASKSSERVGKCMICYLKLLFNDVLSEIAFQCVIWNCFSMMCYLKLPLITLSFHFNTTMEFTVICNRFSEEGLRSVYSL